MFAKYKPTIIILSVIALIAAGIVHYVKDFIGQPLESAPEHLQVKAPAEKILHSQKINDEQGNDIVKYLYASETEVPAVTIKIDEQEIKEDISKRTKNAQFFKKGGLHSGEALWSQNEDKQAGSTASLRSDYEASAGSSTAPVAAGDNGAVAGEKEVWVGRFYAGEPFYKDAGNNKWYQTETATTTAEEFSKQTKPNFLAKLKAFFNMNVLADTGSYYAGAGDGHIYLQASSWDACHNAVTGTAAYPTNTSIEIRSGEAIGTFKIYRGFLPIDTSAIADDAIISSTVLKLYNTTNSNEDNDGNDFVVVVGETTQTETTTLVIADYDTCGTIHSPSEGSLRIDQGDLVLNQYNDFTFNATGISWINKTGTTKIGIRTGHDVVDHAITAATMNRILFASSEDTSGIKDPYLEVIYTVPAAPAKFRFDGGQMKIQGKVKFE